MKKNLLKSVHIGYGRFILVAIPVISNGKVKRARAVLNMDKLRSIGAFSNKMELIRESIRNNAASFPAPPVSVANGGQFDNDIKALNSSQFALVSGRVQQNEVSFGVVCKTAYISRSLVYG
ncbi:MAG: hypothetical protein ABR968_11775 [Bacteroidales bacterium]|jgi:hypothetical protein